MKRHEQDRARVLAGAMVTAHMMGVVWQMSQDEANTILDAVNILTERREDREISADDWSNAIDELLDGCNKTALLRKAIKNGKAGMPA